MAPALRMTRFYKEMQTIFFSLLGWLSGWLVRKKNNLKSLDLYVILA